MKEIVGMWYSRCRCWMANVAIKINSDAVRSAEYAVLRAKEMEHAKAVSMRHNSLRVRYPVAKS